MTTFQNIEGTFDMLPEAPDGAAMRWSWQYTVLRINTLEDEPSRPSYKEALQAYFEPHFALESPHISAQRSLVGGGCYGLLAQEVGSKQRVPAVGFAAGLERLILALDAQGIERRATSPLDAVLIALGDEAVQAQVKNMDTSEQVAVASDALASSLGERKT